jgi:hypothetical protein
MGFATRSGHRPDPVALPILRIGFTDPRSELGFRTDKSFALVVRYQW